MLTYLLCCSLLAAFGFLKIGGQSVFSLSVSTTAQLMITVRVKPFQLLEKTLVFLEVFVM